MVFIGALSATCFQFGWIGRVSAQSDENISDADVEFFESKVRPILADHCFKCHGKDPQKFKGGLLLTSRQSILSGGDTGPAIVPGKPSESLLIDAINYGDVYQMPPSSKLPQEKINILTQWVKINAPWPGKSEVAVAATNIFDLEKRKAEHWCWQPIRRPEIPAVTDMNWPSDDIDKFILSRLERAGLKPARPADRQSLVRRVYFDLIGLPPEPEAVAAFVNDPSDDAFAKVVDQLLASPRFGERWARHWMDLTRYAETCGHEFDYPIPYAFEYRDYLIRAFNADVPFDKFVVEHIAGDLVKQPRINPDENSDESVLGTGFWFLHEATHGPVDVKGDEAGRIDNQIDVMCKTFLGLTVACARCHDHKFDAISTEDYYALAGYLQSSRRQLALLDPGQKIAAAFEECNAKVDQGQQRLCNGMKGLSQSDPDKIAADVACSIDWLRQDAQWNTPAPIKFQGQSFKNFSVDGGTAEVQHLDPQGDGFRWEGDQQLWWRDAQPGNALTIKFELPRIDGASDSHAQSYQVYASLTHAVDYGKARLTLSDQVLENEIDFFSRELTNERHDLGKVELRPGEQQLKIEITGANSDAVQRHMFGIDYLELVPQWEGAAASIAIETFAEHRGRDVDAVRRWVDLIRCNELSSPTHDLHDLYVASKSGAIIDGKQRYSDLTEQARQAAIKLDSTQLFEDFNNPNDWFVTGNAFDKFWDDSNRFSAEGSLVTRSGVVNSGRFGGSFQGVLRSPTFTIERDRIHIFARGSGVRVRLIIDGFELDTYNPLLFNGCSADLNRPDRFEWLTMGGDIQNYKGHRAYLEFIDHGNGFCQIDEIRFSNNDQPGPDIPPSQFAIDLNSARPTTVSELSAAFAKTLVSSAESDSAAEVLSLISQYHSTDSIGLASHSNGSTSFVSHQPPLELDDVRSQLKAIASQIPAPRYAIAMTSGTDEDEFLFIRGNHNTLGNQVRRRFLSAMPESDPTQSGLPPAEMVQGKKQNDERLWLAERIASDSNPLTRRVIVNRLWHHLMGRGIVPSVDNFGVLGQKPTHPELLDYLADEFSVGGWSIKKMIRRIVLSQTYRMSSELNPNAKVIDPDNSLLHRARVRRLQGEAIRDSILQIAGGLNLQMYGPPVPIHLTEFMQGRGRPGNSGPLDEDGRRSIYTEVRRNFISPMMLAFDTPTPFNTMGRRTQSNVPAQALILMNDPLVIQQAQRWASQLIQQDSNIDDRIIEIYQRAFSRTPSEQELAQSSEFIQSLATEQGIEPAQIASSLPIWRDYCHVIFNVKEFIYIQ